MNADILEVTELDVDLNLEVPCTVRVLNDTGLYLPCENAARYQVVVTCDNDHTRTREHCQECLNSGLQNDLGCLPCEPSIVQSVLLSVRSL